MYCPQCGRQIPDDSKFCPLCGAVTVPKVPAEQPAAPHPEEKFMFDTGPSGTKAPPQEPGTGTLPLPPPRTGLPYPPGDILVWVGVALAAAGAAGWWSLGWNILSPLIWITAVLVILAALVEGIPRKVLGLLELLGSLGLLYGIVVTAIAGNTTYWGNVGYYGWQVDTPLLVISGIGAVVLLVMGGKRLLGKRGVLFRKTAPTTPGPGAPGKTPAMAIGIAAIVIAGIVIGYPLYSQLVVPPPPVTDNDLPGGGEYLPRATTLPTTPPTSPPRTSSTLPTTRATATPTARTTSPPPNALFTASTTSGYAPLTVSFTDDSTGFPTAWTWDFGDGSTATVRNPVHTYPVPGMFSVRLTVTGPGGSSTSYPQLIQVTSGTVPSAVVAAFSATPGIGVAPLTVTFTDLSGGSPASYSWEFGDGGTSTQPSPVHTYTTPGQYIARLTVRSGSGATSTATAPQPIVVQAPATTVPATALATSIPTTTPGGGSSPPSASFTFSPDLGPVPLTVSFQDASTGTPTGWFWDFGDGTSSTQRNPVHTYQEPGDFYPLLTVTNAAGSGMTMNGPISVFGIL